MEYKRDGFSGALGGARETHQLTVTWVQQRQHHRAHESARERMLSLAQGGDTQHILLLRVAN